MTPEETEACLLLASLFGFFIVGIALVLAVICYVLMFFEKKD